MYDQKKNGNNILDSNKWPRITVVTPSYNQGAFLEDTIHSIVDQGYPNLEYVICDGGSTDDSVEIIKKYEDRISWWCSEKDKGQTDAINKGMRRATGDIVGWINSDDVMFANSLFVIAQFYVDHPDCEFANGIVADMNKEGVIQKFTHIIMSKFFMKHGWYNICQQGMFWKRSLFEKVGFLDDSFHAKMDVEWLIRNYEANTKVMLLNKPVAAIRVYGETKTAMGGNIWKDDAEKIYNRYNGLYTPNRHSLYGLLFYFNKLCRGCYFRNWIWGIRYKGKNYREVDIK